MKSIFIRLFIILSSYLFSQDKISVNYVFNYEYDISKSDDPKVIELYKVSNSKTADYTLFTTKDESFFYKINKINNNQDDSELNSIPLPDGEHYFNYNDKYQASNLDFRGQLILIKDTLECPKWVISREQNEILGYKVRKAIVNKGIVTDIAWFAPDLPFKSGPKFYCGLPGVILKVETTLDQDDGIHKMYYNATKVELNNKIKIIEPKKGKIFTENEFTKYFNDLFRIEAEIENNKVETKID